MLDIYKKEMNVHMSGSSGTHHAKWITEI